MNPVKPSRIKALIPGISGLLCERIEKLFQFPGLFWEDQSYKYNEAGLITTAHANDICTALKALGCVPGSNGGSGGNPNMPAPVIEASDIAFTDKIRVTITPVAPPTGIDAVATYKIYRSDDDNLDPANAVLVGTVAAPFDDPIIFDDPVDGDLLVGVRYVYWATAENDHDPIQRSAYSIPDYGKASASLLTLPPISDLQATQGFDPNAGGLIGLVFTAPDGATKYSVYRNTVNDFATATLIITDITPQNTGDHYLSTQSPDQCWDNVDSILIQHAPPFATVHYFFWVVAKKDSPAAISVESNAAEGWCVSHYDPFFGNPFKLEDTMSATEGVDFTGLRIRVILFGPGGGGAGGSQIYGGGGGGGGPVIVEEFDISASDVLSVDSIPSQPDTGNAAALANGAEFTNLAFKINGVTMMLANGGHGGQFNPAGGGAGGLGETGTGTTTPTIYNGHAGLPGVGSAGGSSGYRFGNKRYPAAHFDNFSGSGYDGNATSVNPGGGSKAAPGTEILAVGGSGRNGYAIIVATVL